MSTEDKSREEFEAKCERSRRVSARYDELMREGKHGHYETMFRVVREEVEASRRTYRASEEAEARIAELEEEVAVDDKLLATQYRLMDAIPGCELHGNRCVPHAVEWVTTIRAKTLENAAKVCEDNARIASGSPGPLFDVGWSSAAECFARAIRALAEGQ